MVSSKKEAWLKEGVTMEMRGTDGSGFLAVIMGLDPHWPGVSGAFG
jgi:hypothetical protein